MTREEAIKRLKEARFSIQPYQYINEVLDMAIKALEYELRIDKIRTEIMDWQTDIHDNQDNAEVHDFVFERIYEIIDEYRTESDK